MPNFGLAGLSSVEATGYSPKLRVDGHGTGMSLFMGKFLQTELVSMSNTHHAL